jgi:predicted TIM-barrel fold metal-dependent hydrolase
VLVGEVGADRIVFGSNAPAGVATHGVNGMRDIGLDPADEALILGANLARIYGLVS